MSNMETQFTIGQKVRFRQDGEIGIMNKYMYANDVMLGKEYEVTDITGGVARIVGYNLYFDVPLGCIELVPEPQPKFANIKVGDWVELAIGKHFQVKRIVEQSLDCDDRYFMLDGYGCDANARYDFNGNNMYKEFCGSNDIVKVLSHKEVVVDFGSGIKGTIEKASDYAYFLVWHSNNDCDYSMIKLAALDPKTRAIVESLTKAQEEACQ